MHEGVYRHAWSKSLHKGGSGLEIVAWLGDLGGGAGKLAIDRVGKPKKTVEVTSKNRSSDHGVSINLEADIGTYVITRDPHVPRQPTAPFFEERETTADALRKSSWDQARFKVYRVGGALTPPASDVRCRQ